MADYHKTIALMPEYGITYAYRGELKRKNGDAQGALADFDKAIERAPEFALSYVSRSELRVQSGDLDGALSDCNRAVQLAPANLQIHSARVSPSG